MKLIPYNKFRNFSAGLVLSILLSFITASLSAQMLADFETPVTSPDIYAEDSTAIVDNPDKSGINTSDKVGYYRKIESNWHYVNLPFPDTISFGNNNTLTFKVRSSTQGRVYAKFYYGSEVPVEGWAPVWQFMPAPNTWTACEMDITEAMGKKFTLLQLAVSVDNDAEADVWIDDVKLSNPLTGDGSPLASMSVSSGKIVQGDEMTFDASESYDYDGYIVQYLWDFGDGTSDTGKIVIHSYAVDSVYQPTLTLLDNEGKTASTKKYVFVVPDAGKVSAPLILTPTLQTNKKIEAIFQVNGDYANPYDPDEVSIDALITCPDGTTLKMPCFYYTRVSNESGEWVKNDFESWMLRFISEQEGSHTLQFEMTDSSGTDETRSFIIDIDAGDTRGIIRADTVDRQYYRHSTGETYYPLGINAGWNTIGDYTKIINKLSNGGANVFRYWQTPFSHQALEWHSDYWYDYEGLGKYNQVAAAMSDSLLDLCEAVDVNMQLVILQHGMFSENVNEMWEDNPYNIANGGFVDRAEKFFYNQECKHQAKKLLRYIVARWAYSGNLFAWEFFNEVQFTGVHNSQSTTWYDAVSEWHSEMSRYITSIDPYDHLQTTSASHEQLEILDTIKTLDNLQYHLYQGESTLLETQTGLDYKFRKELELSSIINGEYGTNNEADTPFDMQRHAIWNGIMTQVPRYMWIWSHYTDPVWANLFKMPALYLEDENLSGETNLKDYHPDILHPDKSLQSYGLTTGTKYYAYLYDPENETSITGTSIEIPDLPVAFYDIEFYLPVSGQVIREDSISPVLQSNKIDLPAFSQGLAFKLKYRSEYVLPLARAGNDTVVAINKPATLSGHASTPYASSELTYLWRISEKPEGSIFILTDSTSMQIDITPDLPGKYILNLVVDDGAYSSAPDEIMLSVSAPPVAVLGNDTIVNITETFIRINGTSSFDPDGDPITYIWKLLAAPVASDSSIIGGTESGLVTLHADAAGTFILELVVSDGYSLSSPDTILIQVMDYTGVDELWSGSQFLVFPNPTGGKINIAVTGNEEIFRVEATDLTGRTFILSGKAGRMEGEQVYDLSKHLPSHGMYILRITGSSHTEYRKVLLTK